MLNVPATTNGKTREVARLRLSYHSLGTLFALCDAVIILLSSLLGGIGYHLIAIDQVGDVFTFLSLGLAAYSAYSLVAWNLGLYSLAALLQPRRDYAHIFTAWLLSLFLLVLLLFLLKLGTQASRGATVC